MYFFLPFYVCLSAFLDCLWVFIFVSYDLIIWNCYHYHKNEIGWCVLEIGFLKNKAWCIYIICSYKFSLYISLKRLIPTAYCSYVALHVTRRLFLSNYTYIWKCWKKLIIFILSSMVILDAASPSNLLLLYARSFDDPECVWL